MPQTATSKIDRRASSRLTSATGRAFWDKAAEKYGRTPIADEASYQKKLEVTRRYLRPEMEVFEFGCGTGSTALAHAPFVKHVLATDISPGMLDIARRKAIKDHVDNVTFEQATIEDVEIADGSIDMVLGLSILHLLPDKETAIAKVRRMLRPGGSFVTSTHCLGDGRHKYLKPILPVLKLLGVAPGVFFFTRRQLEDSLEHEGFQIEHAWQPVRGKAVFIVARKPQ